MIERRPCSSFKRPVIERKLWVPTPVPVEHRRGSYTRVAREAQPVETVKPRRSGATRDKATRAHFDRLTQHGCIACALLYCAPSPAQIHHPRAFAGGGQKADDWLAIPLCEPHHTGAGGVHGDRSVLRQLGFTSEAPLLAITLRRVYG